MRRRNFVQGASALTSTAIVGCHGDPVAAGAGVSDPMPVALDEDEAAGLRFMREEEKVARDVYLQLGERYDRRVFANIAESEQRHMDAVLELLNRYGVEDPAAGRPVGDFADASLQALHDELLERGLTSEEEAMRVGALIEEVDILDLRERAAETDEAALKAVYGNLEGASERHLSAFVRQLDRLGVEYEPVRLDGDDYDSILGRVDGPSAGRGRGWGRGRGRGGGRGHGRGRGRGGGRGRGRGCRGAG